MSSTLAAQDRRIHRCTCGAWLYGARPCTVCAIAHGTEAAA